MKKLLCAMLAVTLLLGLATTGSAQGTSADELKPVITISFAGYDQLMANIKTAGQLADRPELGDALEGRLAIVTQGKGLVGVDKSRPWGVVVTATEDGQFPVQAYVPVTDLKQLMSLVPNPATGEPFAPDAEGVYEVKGAKMMYIAQKGKWAYIVDNRDALKTVPADPAALLKTLTSRYSVAIRASAKNVPAAVRERFTEQAKMMFEMVMQQRQSGETDEQFAIRTNLTRQQFEKVVTLSKELDEAVLGWGVDASAGSTFLDFEVTALPGTHTAKQFAKAKDAKTDFAGFLIPGAAVNGVGTNGMDESDVDQSKQILAKVRLAATQELDANSDLSDDQRKLAKQLLDDSMDVLVKTLESKQSDAGFALLLDTDTPTFVAGMKLVEGVKLEGVVQKLVAEVAKDEPKLAKMVKLNADKHGDVNFHVVTVPITEPEAAAIFGPTIDIVVGISEDRLFLGAGKAAIKTLKEAIDASKKDAGKATSPLQITVSGIPIAKFIAKVAPDEMVKEKAAEILKLIEKSAGKDHVTIVSKAIPNGASVRLTVEEGLLRAGLSSIPMGGPAPRPMPKAEKKAAPSKEADPF